jgi:hypothetical protein
MTTRPSCRGRRRGLLAFGAVAVLGLGLSLRFGAGPARADSSFDATAAAYGFDAILSNQSIPAGISPELAGPTAQSQLNSLPQGTSFASFPYPGDVVSGLPGLVGALFVGLPPLPPYPFIVTSGLSDGAKSVNHPGIALSADTEPGAAHAHAVFGTDASGAVSDSQIAVASDGSVTATADARASTLNLGLLGSIDDIHSTASARQGADGTVKTSSSLDIGRLNFAGLQITIPNTTPTLPPVPGLNIPNIPLPLAGTTLVAPDLGLENGQFTISLPLFGNQKFAIPSAPVLGALKALGIDASFQPAQTTATSVVGATLTLHYIAPAPPNNQVYTGPTNVDWVVGRATASIQGARLASSGGDSSNGSIAAGSSVSPGGLPGGGTPSLATPTPTGAPLSPISPPSLAASPDQPNPQIALGSGRIIGRRVSLNIGIYLALVAAGLIGTFGTQELRLLGVRHR